MDKVLFKKVVICGMGVMGGSLGYTLLKQKITEAVWGLVRRQGTVQELKKLKLVTAATTDAREALKDADLIVLAIPPLAIKEQMKSLLPYLKKTMIITDVCSVKKSVVGYCEKSLKNSAQFIGSHPMTGTEKFGFSNYKKNLYKNTPCIITPTKNSNPEALKKVRAFWESAGSKIFMMSPEEHDISVSYISHLPHVLSYSLSNTVIRKHKTLKHIFAMAAGSYRDMTRISGSSPDLWSDIFLDNRKEIMRAVKEFRKQLDMLLSSITKPDRARIFHFLNNGYNCRKKFEELKN